jgi:uncharacterized protein
MAKKNAFDYFDAFEKVSALAVDEANVLIETVESFSANADVDSLIMRVHQLENRGDEINHAVFQNTAIEFITPIEREDIITLARALDTVLDEIEDVVFRFYMFNVREVPDKAIRFAEIIKEAAIELDKAMAKLKGFKKHSQDLHALLVKVNDYEEEGDRLYMDAIRELFTRPDANSVDVLRWMEIYRHMERCCDACEHAADAVSMVLLKNS